MKSLEDLKAPEVIAASKRAQPNSLPESCFPSSSLFSTVSVPTHDACLSTTTKQNPNKKYNVKRKSKSQNQRGRRCQSCEMESQYDQYVWYFKGGSRKHTTKLEIQVQRWNLKESGKGTATKQTKLQQMKHAFSRFLRTRNTPKEKSRELKGMAGGTLPRNR